MDFAKLRRGDNTFAKLKERATETLNAKAGGEDKENYWKCEVDKAGNGMATFRFLPAPPTDGEDGMPWVKIFNHGFQGPGGKWLIENCPTSKGQTCPICEANSVLWNSGIDDNKAIAREQKRKLAYVANVYIISDPKNPENEGKVKLFKFGKKIFDKITEAMNPEFDDETPLNPFDLWEGANFKLKIRKVDGYQNYDRSEFESPAPLLKDDAKMEEIWKSEYSLSAIVDDKKFKTYDDLKARMQEVLGNNTPRTTVETLKEAAHKSSRPNFSREEDSPMPPAVSDDDDLDYFSKLAED